MAAPPVYRERPPPAALRSHVACAWNGRLGDDGTPYADRVLPDGCVDLVWDGSRLFVAGPDTGPVAIERRPGGTFAGVRFRPGMAPAVLGLPASELLDRRVDAAAVFGDGPARALTHRLHGRDPAAAAAALEATVAAWMAEAGEPDPAVQGVIEVLAHASSAVNDLAAGLGLSERQLHRRCTAALGYGPKTFDRIVRFRRFLAEAARVPRPLATLAVNAGYADQAHLTRECRRLAGVTPAALVSDPFNTGGGAPR